MVIRDGDWVLFNHDFQLKRTTWVRHNPDGSDTYRTDYVVDDIVEANREMRNSVSKGWKGDLHKVAALPHNVYNESLAEAVRQDDQKYVSRFLNDSDNSAWRTKEGRV